LLLFCALGFGVAASATVKPLVPFLDDNGRPALISYRAQRVVTLAPSLTELVYAAGAHANLIGVSAYSDFPEQARHLPQVADATGISFEALLALKPDLVLAWKGGTKSADIARMVSLGLNVFVVEVRQHADVPRVVRIIGQLVARPIGDNTPELFASMFEAKLEKLQSKAISRKPVRVFFEISQMPLMTVNGRHFISETIKLCGGKNVFADVTQMVIEPSRETLLQVGADAILRPASIHKDAARDKVLYSGLSAYRNGRIYTLNGDWILRPGPRVLLAAEEVCVALDQARASLAMSKK
jgi:iron complex transport system substrate-binding protein